MAYINLIYMEGRKRQALTSNFGTWESLEVIGEMEKNIQFNKTIKR